MGFNYSPKIVTDGLVLYLDAANTKSYVSGSTMWNDLSRNKNNVLLVNGPIFSNNNEGCLIFDGVTNYMDTPLNLTPNNSTQNVWLYWNGTNVSITFSSIGNPGIEGVGMYISNTINGGVGNKIAVLYGSILYSATTNIITLTANAWTMVTVTRDNTTTTLYQNGAFIDSTTSTPNNSTSNLPYIGVAITNNINTSGITIASQSVYNRALSATEVQQNYNTLKTRFGLT